MRAWRRSLATAVTVALLAANIPLGMGISWAAPTTGRQERTATADGGEEWIVSHEDRQTATPSGLEDRQTATPSVAEDSNGVTYATLLEAFLKAETGATITLNSDLEFTTDDIVYVPMEVDLTLDMNGHTISAEKYDEKSKLKFNGHAIINYGTLTVTGEGAIDVSASKYGGKGAIDNYGTLTVENGRFVGNILANNAAIYNQTSGVVQINGGYFEGTAAFLNKGEAVIKNGTFYTFSNNTLYGSNGQVFSYCINNKGNLTIYDATVTGVQGALSLSGGTGTIHGGHYETVAYEGNANPAFYGLYIAGETGKVKAEILGGTFRAVSKVAVKIGNNNAGGDGGDREDAAAVISGGTFYSGEVQGYVAEIDYGAVSTSPRIDGGSFVKKEGITDQVGDDIIRLLEPGGKSKTSLDTYITEDHTVVANEDNTEFVVKKKQDISGAAIDYKLEQITGLSESGSQSYLVTVDGTETPVSGENTIKLQENWFGKTITLQAAEDESYAASEAIELAIPARPAAPENLIPSPSEKTKKNGSISGVSPEMEYSKENSGYYQPISGEKLENLAAGAYLVRIKATDTTFASLPVSVTVDAIRTKQETPAPQIDYGQETLTGFSPNGTGTYRITFGTEETVFSGDSIRIAEKWFGKEVSIREAGDENYEDSEAVAVKIPARPAAPKNLLAGPASAEGAVDGSISGVTPDMEYAPAGSGQYRPVEDIRVEGLASGYYDIRIRAGQSSFASRPSQVFVATDDEKASAVNAAIEAGNAILAQQGVSGTLKTITDKMLSDGNIQSKLAGARNQIQSIYNTLLSVFGTEKDLEAYLAENPERQAEIENLRKMLSAACNVQVAEVSLQAGANADRADTPSLPPISSDLSEEERAELENQAAVKTQEAVKTVKEEVSSNLNAQKKPMGLEEAVGGSIAEILKGIEGAKEAENVSVTLSVEVVYEGMEAKAQVTEDGETRSVEVVPAKITFSVHPVYSAEVDGAQVAKNQQVENDCLNGEKITFFLPVPSSVTQKYAKVRHILSSGDFEDSYPAIRSKGENAYVEVSASEFSTFEMEFTDERPDDKPVPSRSSDDGGEIKTGGSWRLDQTGWWYEYARGGYPRAQWLELPWNGVMNWYYFNEAGYLATGWLQDGEHRYYLHPFADGTRGYMYTGWHQIDGKWYYFMPQTGGPKGALARNTTTPDGRQVDENGVAK